MTDPEIRLSIPAQSRFVATARVTTAGIAAELGYSIEEIDGLRTGVNELVATLIEYAEDNGIAQVDLVFRPTADALEIEGRAGADSTSASAGDSLDELTHRILSGVVDDHELAGNWGRIVKRRVAA